MVVRSPVYLGKMFALDSYVFFALVPWSQARVERGALVNVLLEYRDGHNAISNGCPDCVGSTSVLRVASGVNQESVQLFIDRNTRRDYGEKGVGRTYQN